MELGGYKEDELWDAVSNRNLQAVKRALAKGADASCIAPDGWVRSEASGKGGRSILHHAAYVGDLEVFRALVEQGGADMLKRRQRNWATFRGNTPFHTAAFYGRLEVLQYCIETGADVNMQGEQGYTCLHLAAKFGYVKMAEYLLANGARTDVITKDEQTPTRLAKTEEIRELLLRNDNASVRMHKNLPTLPEAASAQYLKQGWAKGDTDTFRNPDARPSGGPAPAPLGSTKDVAQEDTLRGRSARFLKSRGEDPFAPAIGKENVNMGRDRMMPQLRQEGDASGRPPSHQQRHGRRAPAAEGPGDYAVNAFPRPDVTHEQRELQLRQLQQLQQQPSNSFFLGGSAPQQSRGAAYGRRSPSPASQPHLTQKQPPQQYQQPPQQYQQPPQQQQYAVPHQAQPMGWEDAPSFYSQAAEAEWAHVPGNSGWEAGGRDELGRTAGHDQGRQSVHGGAYDDAPRDVLPPGVKTGFEDMSDEELLAKLAALRGERFEDIAQQAAGMQRKAQDQEMTEHGAYGMGSPQHEQYGGHGDWQGPRSGAQQQQQQQQQQATLRKGNGSEKGLLAMQADMDAFVQQRMLEQAVKPTLDQHQPARRMAKACPTPGTRGDEAYEEAVVKERRAMMALADTRRKISSLHAQNTARSILSSSERRNRQEEEDEAVPPRAGLVGEGKGGAGKAVDSLTGEGFYSSAKTTGNLLMHDAMYTAHAKKQAMLPPGGVHPALKSTRPW